MSEPDALYAYGVVSGDADASLFAGVVGVGSTSVDLLAEADVAAIVGRVSLEEFGEEPLRGNLERPAWVAEQARAHDRVLAQAVGRTALVPFRFGTVYMSDAHVRGLLRARSAELTRHLARLRGLVELGVKGFAPDAEPVREEAPAGGRDYLLLKRRERTRATETAAAVHGEAVAVHERLASLGDDARANPPQSRALSGRRAPMLLNGAYLVPVERQDAFAAAVEELRGGALELELTGPWPPYNFVRDDG